MRSSGGKGGTDADADADAGAGAGAGAGADATADATGDETGKTFVTFVIITSRVSSTLVQMPPSSSLFSLVAPAPDAPHARLKQWSFRRTDLARAEKT